MARVKGNKTPVLSLKIGAASATDFGAYVVSVEFVDGEGSPLTMADYASGTTPKAMNVEWALDWDAAAPYEYHYANSGATNATWVFQPASGTVSQTNPKFTGTLTMPTKPNFAIEAGTEDQTFEVSYALDTFTKAIA